MGCGDHGVSSGGTQFTCHLLKGALGIEARSNDTVMRELLTRSEHHPTRTTVTAERALLHRLEGDARFLSWRMPCSRARPDAGWPGGHGRWTTWLFGIASARPCPQNAHPRNHVCRNDYLADGADVILKEIYGRA